MERERGWREKKRKVSENRRVKGKVRGEERER